MNISNAVHSGKGVLGRRETTAAVQLQHRSSQHGCSTSTSAMLLHIFSKRVLLGAPRQSLLPLHALPPPSSSSLSSWVTSSSSSASPSSFPPSPAEPLLSHLSESVNLVPGNADFGAGVPPVPVQQLLYSLADAAAVQEVLSEPAEIQRAGGWVAPLADGLEFILRFIQNGLDVANIPYSYGYSIILLTLVVKVATFPLTKQQVESQMAVQSLKPRIDLIKKRFGDDKDKVSKETNLLYEQAGVNPLAGCLPTLATIPIFIGLYSSLTNAANEGLFDTQGFYWLPSLAGPTTVAARQSGAGTAWLYPLIDGVPPIGWDEATRYLALPILLVLTQYVSAAIVNPPIDKDDPNANTARAVQTFVPLMIGWFSLNVPSGLSLYYFSNTVLTTLVQIYLKKLGGANVVVNDLGPVTKPGSGRRSVGAAAASGDFVPWVSTTVLLKPVEGEGDKAAKEGSDEPGTAAAMAATADVEGGPVVPRLDPAAVSRRVKRRKMSLIVQNQQVRKQQAMQEQQHDATAAAAANGATATA